MTYERIFGIFFFGLIVAFIAPIISTLFGAFAGWIVGLVFEDAIMGFLARIWVKVEGLTMWQLGAALGFIGGYLKTTVHENRK